MIRKQNFVSIPIFLSFALLNLQSATQTNNNYLFFFQVVYLLSSQI